MDPSDMVLQNSETKLEFLERLMNDETYAHHQQTVITLARDADPQVRERAMEAFWEMADPTYIDLLSEMARTDPAIEVRRAAITALGRYIYEGFVLEEIDETDYEAVKDLLLSLYHDAAEPLDVRRSCIEALGFITDDDIEALIREAYRSPDHKMKISAIFAMGRSGTRTWDDILAEELHSQDAEVRFEAVRAAGETFMSRAAETLEIMTRDPDRDVQIEAILSLGKAGRPQSRVILRSLTSSPDEDIRDAAAEALDELDLFESEAFADES